MPNVTPEYAPNPRAMIGWDGSNFHTIAVDSDGNVQVDILTGAATSGLATSARQDTMITALQLIDNLVGALTSLNTDSLQVRGEDQLFSYQEPYQELVSSNNVAAGAHTLQGSQVPAGEVWVITSVCAYNTASANAFITPRIDNTSSQIPLTLRVTTGGLDAVVWSGYVPIEEGHRVDAYFSGCTLNDSLRLDILGFKMSKES